MRDELGTLRQVVEALGGALRIEAVFPDGVVTLRQFEEAPA